MTSYHSPLAKVLKGCDVRTAEGMMGGYKLAG